MDGRQRFFVGDKGKDSVIDYNAPQEDNSFEAKSIRLEFWMAKQIGEDLCRIYPNRQWGVDVDARNLVVTITAPSLSKVMGYLLHIKQGETMAQLLPRCRRAAGEILERYGVSRARKVDPLVIEEELPRDFRDNVISSDALPEKRVRNA